MTSILIATILSFSLVGYRGDAPVTIRGTVYNQQTGTALTGVEVVREGTKAFTQTDANGAYTILAEKGDYLVFQYIGYETQRVKVGNDKVIDIHLRPEMPLLDEAMVPMYGRPEAEFSARPVINIAGNTGMMYIP